MSRRIRTFIAVGIDKATRDRTVALQETLARSGVEVKWVEPENLHVTLLFLGEVDERDIADVCEVVSETCQGFGPFPMSVESTGCFPNARRPNVIWAGLGEGKQNLVELHDALEPPLLDLGCYRREARQYNPHLTLGRLKGDEETEPLVVALNKQTGWRGGVTNVTEVWVMSSEMRSKGPVYTILSRAKLTGEEE